MLTRHTEACHSAFHVVLVYTMTTTPLTIKVEEGNGGAFVITSIMHATVYA